MTKSATSATERGGRIIRASELAQYAYCARAWWLGSVLGVRSTNTHDLQRGQVVHQIHGRQVWWSRALLMGAGALIVLAVLAVLVGLFFSR